MKEETYVRLTLGFECAWSGSADMLTAVDVYGRCNQKSKRVQVDLK